MIDVEQMKSAMRYLQELIRLVESFGLGDIEKCGRKEYACMYCKYFDNHLNHDLCSNDEYFVWKHIEDAKELVREYESQIKSINDSPSVIIKSQNDNVCNTGTWLSEYDDKFGFHYVCSECGTISGVRLKFCFDCGADMRGDES